VDDAPQLRQSIGLFRATTMVVGIIIGASIFVQPSAITAEIPTVGGVLLVWSAAGLLTLIGSLVIAELSSAWPRTGGVYVWLNEAYSPLVGFLWGWAMFWTMHSGIIAAIATVFARYVGTFVPLSDIGTKVVAVGAVCVLSAVNYRGIQHGTAVQAVLTVVKVAAILLIIAIGAMVGTHLFDAPTAATAPVSVPGFFTALVAGLFAYGGWHMVSYSAEETRDPTRTIPKALLIGTLAVTALYVAVNAAYMAVLPIDVVRSSTRVAADFADAAIGGSGRELMAILVMLSTLGAANGVILAGPRVYLAMSRDGVLFRWLGDVHPQYRTPHRAIVVQAVWSSVLVATGSYRVLFTRVVYTEWIFFALLAASLLILRKRADYTPSYRVWGYPVLPLLFVLSSVAIVVNQVITQPYESLFGLMLVMAGVPAYLLWARRRPPTGARS
jgi:APA family basic amino acid/polyamine antiporter